MAALTRKTEKISNLSPGQGTLINKYCYSFVIITCTKVKYCIFVVNHDVASATFSELRQKFVMVS